MWYRSGVAVQLHRGAGGNSQANAKDLRLVRLGVAAALDVA